MRDRADELTGAPQRLFFGPESTAQGTRFRLWAPSAQRVDLKATTPAGKPLQIALTATGEGWFETCVPDAGVGTRYGFRIDGELDVPDPASRFQPEGVPGAAEVIAPNAFARREQGWRGRPWHEAVLYELHVGTFTSEGTYQAAIQRLDELAELGITAIELLPLNTFPGHHGWGYDGVLLYAPHPAYGRPEELQQFVQAAHERNLMVLIDVVYNHFGPEGNYLHRYAADFFTAKHQTPWGSAINFAHPVVRDFFIQNALYWLNQYHFDGLRVDAVHAMFDDGNTHFIDELVEAVAQGPGSERHVHVVLENHHNEARRLGLKGNTWVAQWNDDFHHPLHILLSGESDGYYRDYADEPIKRLGRVLAEGFAYQGETSPSGGAARGEISSTLPPLAFVNFLQNHDQIGNRAFGERLAQLAPPLKLRAGMAILLLSPQIPMLYMGEEYGALQPFLYFCNYQGDLAKAISDGRRNEFGAFGAFADEHKREQIPDPNVERTFLASQLEHQDRERPQHREWLQYTRQLLRLRAEKIVPLSARIVPGQAAYEVAGHTLTVTWPTQQHSVLVLHANLGDSPAAPSRPIAGNILFSTDNASSAATELSPWEVRLLSS